MQYKLEYVIYKLQLMRFITWVVKLLTIEGVKLILEADWPELEKHSCRIIHFSFYHRFRNLKEFLKIFVWSVAHIQSGQYEKHAKGETSEM